MFARIKKSGRYQYLQIVENRREGRKVVQRVISTLAGKAVHRLYSLRGAVTIREDGQLTACGCG